MKHYEEDTVNEAACIRTDMIGTIETPSGKYLPVFFRVYPSAFEIYIHGNRPYQVRLTGYNHSSALLRARFMLKFHFGLRYTYGNAY